METIEAYLEALASAAPAPGGGSAATIVGAMAASLVAMVARITSNSPKYADRAERARKLVDDADVLRQKFIDARADDERAYGEVVAAMALPRATDAERAGRTLQLQAALGEAARAPLDAAFLARDAFALAVRARDLENANLESDVACAAIFANAALVASQQNVKINHAFMKDAELVREQSLALGAIREEVEALHAALQSAMR